MVDILALGRGLLAGTALAVLTVLAVRTVLLITLGLTVLASRMEAAGRPRRRLTPRSS